MVYYIYGTRKNGGFEREITHYQYQTDNNIGTIKSKEDLWKLVKFTFKSDVFYSFHPTYRTKVICEWRQIGDGQPFLQSDPNGTEKDNLLKLPNC